MALSGLFRVVLVVLPEEPVEGYLGAKDGEKECEEAVAELVKPGGIDDEGGGDHEGGDDEEEGGPEEGHAEGAPDGTVRPGLSPGFLRARGQLHQSCLLAAFSVVGLLFCAPLSEEPALSPDSPFFVVSAFEGAPL